MEHDNSTASPETDMFDGPEPDRSGAAIAPSERALPDRNVKAPFARGRGTFFDHYIDLLEPEGATLTERLVEIYDQMCSRARKRERKALRLRLRKLAANALRGHFFRDPPAILYYRGAAIEEWNENRDG